MTVKIIFLNGPPGSGKDTAAVLLKNSHLKAETYRFAKYLKDLTHRIYGIFDVEWDAFEHCKDIVNVKFGSITPRQAYIAVSEKFMKPMFDKQVFGKRLQAQILFDITMYYADVLEDTFFPIPKFDYMAIADSGFPEEAIPLIETFGVDNCLLIHIGRSGYDFLNDSRNYWRADHLGLKTKEVHNVGRLEPFHAELLRAVKGF